ncbi:hypothetical protein [Promicromonospora sp. NPDC023987]|uniref:hypothetical protein n=1 Tax=Promicromonospora sp. NPDC023987 TaxID=3155360 RepID=UPI0033E64992
MKVPEGFVVEKKLADLVAGEIEPDAAADWATQVMHELEDEDVDDGIWEAFDHLSGADLLAEPDVYLHSQDDYRSWLTEFRSSQAQ